MTIALDESSVPSESMRDVTSRGITQRSWFWPAVFLAPATIGFVLFTVYPLFQSLWLSFNDWDLLSPMEWVGIDNYVRMFHDPTAKKVFINTVIFTLVTVPALIVIPFFLAMALNQKIKGIRFFRAAFFLPVISSMVAMSMVWQWMYNADFGLINYFLSLIGIDGPAWLTSSTWALPAVMITSIWKNLGFNMMLFLAGLQGVPEYYYEAASLDGASWFQRMRYITIPQLSATTLFVTVMTVINSFQVFDQVVVMTGGGPARSSSVLVQYIYETGFKFYDMGYASSLGWALTIFVFFLTLIQFRINRDNEES